METKGQTIDAAATPDESHWITYQLPLHMPNLSMGSSKLTVVSSLTRKAHERVDEMAHASLALAPEYLALDH